MLVGWVKRNGSPRTPGFTARRKMLGKRLQVPELRMFFQPKARAHRRNPSANVSEDTALYAVRPGTPGA
jgi:hypothetical protein